MTLTLHHIKNGDITHDERAGYWTPPIDSPRMTVEVSTLREASNALRAWVNRNGLGGGNLARDCGEVRDAGKVVACISYNGRVWQPGKECVRGCEIVLSV